MDRNVNFQYTQAEVVSAQRARFLHSSRLKILALISLAAVVLLAVILGTANWYYPVLVALILGTLLIRAYWLAPILDFRRNQVWHAAYTLHLGPDQFRLTLKGKNQGETVQWRQITRVLESRDAYVLFWGRESEFIVVPPRVIAEADFTDLFRQRLNVHLHPTAH